MASAETPSADAPLSDTKLQLQALKRDEAAQKAGTPSNNLQLDLPTVTTPSLSDLNLTKPDKEDKDAQKKNARKKNWLLDGYDKLDAKKTNGTDPRSKDDSELKEDEKLDPKDPDYFLHVYEKQRAESDAKQRELANANMQGGGDTKLNASADPFAPFMKEWLANSPVRDAIKDSGTVGSTLSNNAPVSAPSNLPADTQTAAIARTTSDSLRTNASNPFLQSLGMPATDSGSPNSELRSPVAVFEPKTASETRSLLPADPAPPRDRGREDPRNALPLTPEDKKYFPQLKKF